MTKWFVRACSRENPEVRLICFPYAGAAAGIFGDWPKLLPEWLDVIAVELPGRASHFSRAPIVEIDVVVAALVAEMAAMRDLPCLFYGHSLGAKIAFELACDLQRRDIVHPAHLIAAARAAPNRTIGGMNPADLGRDDFIALLTRLDATPPEILDHRELMDLLLPTIRADFRLNLSRSAKAAVTLECPVTALHGSADAAVTEKSMLEWSELTTGGFELSTLQGGHFFLKDAKRQTLDRVTRIASVVRLTGGNRA